MRSRVLNACRCTLWVGSLLALSLLCARAQPVPVVPGPSLAPDALADDGAVGAVSPRNPWVPSLRSIGANAVEIFSAPLDQATRHPGRLAAAAGLTATLAATIDGPVQRHFDSGPSSPAPSVAVPHALAGPGRVYDKIGTLRSGLGTAALLAAGGLVRSDRRMTRTSVRVVEALVWAELSASLVKTLAGRHRPYTGSGALAADPVALDGGNEVFSFPSGHTTKAFAVATVVARSYDRWYVQIPAYAVASSAALQRIESGNHWASDVLAGAALGYLIGRATTGTPPAPNRPVNYRPVLSSSRIGLAIQF